jgi:hypothetical protein
VTILGPIVLGAVMAYAMLNRRRLTRTEREAQKRGVERRIVMALTSKRASISGQ